MSRLPRAARVCGLQPICLDGRGRGVLPSKKAAAPCACQKARRGAKGRENMRAVERFCRYAAYDTQSSEASEASPSTEKQLVLAKALCEELKALGA